MIFVWILLQYLTHNATSVSRFIFQNLIVFDAWCSGVFEFMFVFWVIGVINDMFIMRAYHVKVLSSCDQHWFSLFINLGFFVFSSKPIINYVSRCKCNAHVVLHTTYGVFNCRVQLYYFTLILQFLFKAFLLLFKIWCNVFLIFLL